MRRVVLRWYSESQIHSICRTSEIRRPVRQMNLISRSYVRLVLESCESVSEFRRDPDMLIRFDRAAELCGVENAQGSSLTKSFRGWCCGLMEESDCNDRGGIKSDER